MADLNSFKGKGFLVTGGGGFLGSHLCEELLARGSKVIAVDDFITGQKKNVAQLFDKPETFLRAEYGYLSYSRLSTNYWTPQHRSTVGPVLDTTIAISKNLQIVGDAKAPFVFQVQGGPVIQLFKHVYVNASYYYSSIPGDQGAWSGHGWQASLQLKF